LRIPENQKTVEQRTQWYDFTDCKSPIVKWPGIEHFVVINFDLIISYLTSIKFSDLKVSLLICEQVKISQNLNLKDFAAL
jgi:hypothetical protein